MIDASTANVADLAENLGDYLAQAVEESAANWLKSLFYFEIAQDWLKALEQRRANEQRELAEATEAITALKSLKAQRKEPVDYFKQLGLMSKQIERHNGAIYDLNWIIAQLSQVTPPAPLATFQKWQEGAAPTTEAALPAFRPGPKRMAGIVENLLRGRVVFEETDSRALAR